MSSKLIIRAHKLTSSSEEHMNIISAPKKDVVSGACHRRYQKRLEAQKSNASATIEGDLGETELDEEERDHDLLNYLHYKKVFLKKLAIFLRTILILKIHKMEDNVSNESHMRASSDEWELAPLELCRLCASTNEHPKQSIIGWLSVLNGIIPGMVRLMDGLPQYMCRPCVNKLFTCNTIKQQFTAAHNKLHKRYADDTEKTDCGIEDLEISPSNNEACFPETFGQYESNGHGDIVSLPSNRQFYSKEKQKLKPKFNYVCAECEQVFVSKRELMLHREVHCNEKFTNESTHQCEEAPCMCEECGEILQNMKRLISHKNVHRPPKYVCPVCGRKFYHKVTYDGHKRKHDVNRKATCDVCGKVLSDLRNLQIHLRMHTGEKPFQCTTCGLRFISAETLKCHERKHGNLNFKCKICDKVFHSRKVLKSHQECHVEPTTFNCPVCLKAFDRLGYRNAHYEVHCRQCICVVCNQLFGSEETLIEHRSKEHSSEELTKAAKAYRKQRFKKCPVCSQVICGNSNMLKHIDENHSEYNYKPFTCEQCQKTFFTRDKLARHMKCHSEHGRYRCSICDEVFKTKVALKEHELSVHKNECGFLCSVCHCQFKEYPDFVTHKKTHLKNKSFACLVCRKTFCSKQNLVKHSKHLHGLESIGLPWDKLEPVSQFFSNLLFPVM